MDEHEKYIELISEQLDGMLDDAGRAELSGHLASCPECREIFNVLAGAKAALDVDLEPPEELLTGVMGKVEAIKAANRRSIRRRFLRTGAGILAAAAVLAVVIIPGRLGVGKDALRDESNGSAMTADSATAPEAVEPRGAANEPSVCVSPEDNMPVMPADEGYSPDVPQEPGDTVNSGEGEPPDTPDTPDTPDGPDAPEAPAAYGSDPGDGVTEIAIPAGPGVAVDAEPEDGELVDVTDYLPGVFVELRYATEDNFTGQIIYDFTKARLRYGTVKKLAAVQEELQTQGFSLKIWDACRPVSAQFALWEVCPDSRYVANPNKGYSSHSCGNTVDLTLVYADGSELEMPSDFDEFGSTADRDYSDVSEGAAANAKILEDAMTAQGFEPYFAEWWHYSDSDSYPVVEE